MNKQDFARASKLPADDFSLEQRIADGVKRFAQAVSPFLLLSSVFNPVIELPIRAKRTASQLAEALEATGVVKRGEGMAAVESMGNNYEVLMRVGVNRRGMTIDRPQNYDSKLSYRVRYGTFFSETF